MRTKIQRQLSSRGSKGKELIVLQLLVIFVNSVSVAEPPDGQELDAGRWWGETAASCQTIAEWTACWPQATIQGPSKYFQYTTTYIVATKLDRNESEFMNKQRLDTTPIRFANARRWSN